MLLNAGQSLRGFFDFFFLYLPAVYLARALSQQEETKNSSDGKSVVVDLHNSVVQKKKKKERGCSYLCCKMIGSIICLLMTGC